MVSQGTGTKEMGFGFLNNEQRAAISARKSIGRRSVGAQRDPDCPIEVVAMGTRLGAAGQPRG